MLACLAKVYPLDTVSGSRVEIRLSAHNDAVIGRAVNGLDGAPWQPAMAGAPILRITLFNGDFTNAVSIAQAALPINMTVLGEARSDLGRLAWQGAPVEIYADEPGTAWPWALRFKGVVAGYSRPAAVLTLNVAIDSEPFLVDCLPSTYAGTGGAEGPLDLKGRVKPLVLGWAMNVEPVLINAVDSVYQFSAYGAIEAVTKLYERGSDFGASIGDYATYAALVAATIPPGRWATCLAAGMVRLGAPAYGVVTGDIKGHKVGANTPRLTGAVISAIATIAGVSGSLIDSTSLSALDSALPYPINIVLTDQATVLDIAQRLALPCNAQAGIGFDGKLFVTRVSFSTTASLTVDAQGKTCPQVTDSREENVSPPFHRYIMGANRSWRVHSFEEIAFEAPIVPRGLYDAAETYREGNIVSLADGSEWIYVSLTPTAGNAPPTWPTTSNAYWSNTKPPLNAEGITYADGTPIEDLRPAELGATDGAQTGVNLVNGAGTAVLTDPQIVTAQGTAAAITGQGTLATQNNVNLGTQVTGTLGTGNAASGLVNTNISIAANGALTGGGGGQVTIGGLGYTGALNATFGARAGTNIYRTDGTTVMSQAEIRTAEGVASAIAGQGALATKSTIAGSDIGSAVVSFDKLTSTAARFGTNVVRADGATSVTDAAAITSLGTASAIAGQGALATKSTATWSSDITGTGKPQDNADVTALAQVSIALTTDQTIPATYNGTVTSEDLENIVWAPVVTRGGSSIRTANGTTYALSNASGGTFAVDNTNGSGSKGNVTISAMSSNIAQVELTVTVDGVAQPKLLLKVTKTLGAPPPSGGSTPKTVTWGAGEFVALNTTSYTPVVTALKTVALASGESLYGTAPLTYTVSGDGAVTRTMTFKWQYSVAGANSWNDFASPITGSLATSFYKGTPPEYDDASPAIPGSVSVTQTKSGLSAGNYDVRLVAICSATGRNMSTSGSATVEAKT